MPGRLGIAVVPQIIDSERSGVGQVGVQGRKQRRAFLHDSHSGVTVSMNPTLMALGLAEPTLQIKVVPRQVRLVTPDEQAWLEAPHHRRHLLPDRVRLGSQAISQRREGDPTLIARTAGRIDSRPDLDDLLNPLSDRDLRLLDRIESPVDEPGQAAQERFASPPFFASRFRPRDCRTSPNASAIRSPGGSSGPPWPSLRMPRTALQ
jgi:hypothetical protein